MILPAFLIVVLAGALPRAHAETRIFIGVTETMDRFNPYGDSVSLMYSVWWSGFGLSRHV